MSWLGQVRHFSPGGDPALADPDGTRMSLELMLLLDAMREEVGIECRITDGWREDARQKALMENGLSDPNQLLFAHPRGEAADWCFPGSPLLGMFAYACRWPFKGIGLYPYTSTGQPVIHTDIMDRGRPRTALWIRNRVGVYVYAPSREFLHELQMLVASERWER